MDIVDIAGAHVDHTALELDCELCVCGQACWRTFAERAVGTFWRAKLGAHSVIQFVAGSRRIPLEILGRMCWLSVLLVP